jgi:hypothetical protein
MFRSTRIPNAMLLELRMTCATSYTVWRGLEHDTHWNGCSCTASAWKSFRKHTKEGIQVQDYEIWSKLLKRFFLEDPVQRERPLALEPYVHTHRHMTDKLLTHEPLRGQLGSQSSIHINIDIQTALKKPISHIKDGSKYVKTASVVWWSGFLATDPKARVRFQALQDFLRSSGSGTGVHSRPPMWFSDQSSWLQIQRSGFD